MQSARNGQMTYLALQHLAEKAWDERDLPRLMRLSRAVDEHMLACIREEQADQRAV